jgi:uracil-DNA glycosylase
MLTSLDILLSEVRRCTICAAHLPLGPRPIVQLGATARLLIVGQAPGSKVHASGMPWQDDSGHRLREWLGIDAGVFYDPRHVALLPMGFCYPGAANGADLPPRPECAPLWHDRLLAALPDRRLTVLVGLHAQRRYLHGATRGTLTEAVRGFREHLPGQFPLPHPSWRSTGWMRRNAWFEKDVLPALRDAVAGALA